MLFIKLSHRYGEKGLQRIIKWMKDSPLIEEESTVMDLGCGNGAILLAMVG